MENSKNDKIMNNSEDNPHYNRLNLVNSPELKKAERNVSFLAILLLGSLSMLFAEIFSGSSHLWFLDLFGILITFVLYMIHSIFYLNLAIKTRRFHLFQLFLFGMLFALYEAPITKVLWLGYMDGRGPIYGLFLGVAINEFIVLVFFWHPVMSFIMPIIFYEFMMLNSKKKIDFNELRKASDNDFNINKIDLEILDVHQKYIRNSKKNKAILILVFIYCASFQAYSTGGNIFVSLFSVLGTLLIIYILKALLIRRNQKHQSPSQNNHLSFFSFEQLNLSNKGLIFLALFMVFFYWISAKFIDSMLPNRDNIEPIGYISIIIYAFIVIILIKISRPKPKGNLLFKLENTIKEFTTNDGKSIAVKNKINKEDRLLDEKFAFKLFLIYTIFVCVSAIFLNILPSIMIVIMTILYFLMIPLGFICIIWLFINFIKNIRNG